MVLSYDPVSKNNLNRNDPDGDSSEIEFLNPYLIVGVENLLWYGEILDNMDITVIIDQESDGEEPLTFEKMFPELAPAPMPTMTTASLVSSTTNAPNATTTTSTPQQLNNATMAAIFTTLFANLSNATTLPVETSSRTPLASIPEEPSLAISAPLNAKPNAEETEKLYQLLQIFSTMQNDTAASKPGEQHSPPQINLDALLAELNISNKKQQTQLQNDLALQEKY